MNNKGLKQQSYSEVLYKQNVCVHLISGVQVSSVLQETLYNVFKATC